MVNRDPIDTFAPRYSEGDILHRTRHRSHRGSRALLSGLLLSSLQNWPIMAALWHAPIGAPPALEYSGNSARLVDSGRFRTPYVGLRRTVGRTRMRCFFENSRKSRTPRATRRFSSCGSQAVRRYIHSRWQWMAGNKQESQKDRIHRIFACRFVESRDHLLAITYE